MDWVVRPAVPADAAVIADYNARMASEVEHKELKPELVLRGVQEGLARSEICRFFVAESSGRVVGQAMITYEWSDWRCGAFWWLESVYVHPDFRGRGVFRSIYQHISDLARESGACGMRLYVEQNNEGAQSTYRNLGMTPSGHVVYEDDWSGL